VRLLLAPPDGWIAAEEGGRTVARPPFDRRTTLAWTPLGVAPTSPASWFEAVVRAELAPDERAEELRRTPRETADGWPLLVVEDMVVAGADVTAVRLHAFYTFREHCGSATLRAADEASYFGARDAVLARLLAARPDFSGALACLADFYAPDPQGAQGP
jgi:hypothetical protein